MKNFQYLIKILAILLIFSLFSGCQPPLKPPSAPTNLQAEAISQTEIKLTWQDNSNNEDGFKIERKIIDGTYTLIGSVGANVTTYTDTNLTPGTTYIYRVYAYNSAGNSGYSNEASATTLSPQAPQPPSNLTAQVEYPNKIILGWQDNSTNETGFKIYRKVPGGDWEYIGEVGENTCQYTDTPPVLTLLEYKVTAYNESGESTGTTATTQGFTLISTFEDGTGSWFGRGGCTITQDNTVAKTGTYSLKTTGRDQSWKGPSITLYNPQNNVNIITPGKTYYISIWGYQSTGTATEYLTVTMERKLGDGSTKWDTIVWKKATPNSTWTLLSGEYSFPPNIGTDTDTIRADLYVESPNETLEFFIDDVAIVEKP